MVRNIPPKAIPGIIYGINDMLWSHRENLFFRFLTTVYPIRIPTTPLISAVMPARDTEFLIEFRI
jgi:hypothetical protein